MRETIDCINVFWFLVTQLRLAWKNINFYHKEGMFIIPVLSGKTVVGKQRAVRACPSV